MDLRRLALHHDGTTLPELTSPVPRHRRGQQFLKGPIPRGWLVRAMRLRGKALHVALEIWFRVGIKKRSDVVLSLERVARVGCFDRATASRALGMLERAGLVSVRRHAGRAPRVTVLAVDDLEEPQSAESDAVQK